MSAVVLLVEVASGASAIGVLASRRNGPEVRRHLRRCVRRGKAMIDTILGMLRGQDHPAPASTPATPAATAQPRVETSPDMPGLPSNCRPLVKKVNDLMEQIEKRIEGDPMSIPLVVEMGQMRDIHLPRLCRSYIDMPEQHRKDVYARTGKSASYVLGTSLESMIGRLQEIDKALARQQIATFEANASTVNDIYRRGDSNPLA